MDASGCNYLMVETYDMKVYFEGKYNNKVSLIRSILRSCNRKCIYSTESKGHKGKLKLYMKVRYVLVFFNCLEKTCLEQCCESVTFWY
jgi:hypothetical protein